MPGRPSPTIVCSSTNAVRRTGKEHHDERPGRHRDHRLHRTTRLPRRGLHLQGRADRVHPPDLVLRERGPGAPRDRRPGRGPRRRLAAAGLAGPRCRPGARCRDHRTRRSRRWGLSRSRHRPQPPTHGQSDETTPVPSKGVVPSTARSHLMTHAISMDGLTKHYQGVQALTDLTLDVPSGTVFGFLGPNGAGKTTALKVLAGLARATSGSATVNGVTVSAAGDHRRQLGYLAQEPRFYGWMTGRETLRYVASRSEERRVGKE